MIKLVTGIAVTAMLAASAQAINWDGGGGDNLWSNPLNWAGDNTPNNNTETAVYIGSASIDINVDSDHTIQSYSDGFGGAGFTNTLYGAGTLTIDRNLANSPGILNATGGDGGTLRLNGKVTINNSTGGDTLVRNDNSAGGNTTLFDTGSTLTLTTALRTAQGMGGSIAFNGTLASSAADLRIGSDNVSFGTGHNSSAFGRDIVFYSAGSKLAINGGTVLTSGRKIQVNANGELELNGENAINNANVVAGGANNLLIDVNSNQDDMGILRFDSGTVTLDLAAGVSGIAFDNSSAQVWGAGALVISNFTAGVVSFGSNANGLLAAQLGKIRAYDSGGALVEDISLNGAGYVIPEPATIGLIGLASAGFIVLRRLMF